MDLVDIADATRRRIGRVGVWLAVLNNLPAAEVRATARRIEELGFGALWFSENPSAREAFVHSGLLLGATERITVATGIANIWLRDAETANAAARSLAEAHDDRFLFGLGVSHAPLVRTRGHEYTRPLAAMATYLDNLEKAGYVSPEPAAPVPTVLGALRPKMLELARDRTAGAHPYLGTPEHTALSRQVLGPAPLLAPELAVLLETDPDTARAQARDYIKYYLLLPNYVNNLRALGFTDADLADGGSNRLVDAVIAWGDTDAIHRRVQDHLDAGADHVAIQPLGDTSTAVLTQLTELAPALLPN